MLTGHTQSRSAQTRPTSLAVTSLVLLLLLKSVAATAEFGVPANLTVRDSTPYAVCLTWTLGGGGGGGRPVGPVHLQIVYRPVNASYRVVADLLGHRRSVTLDNLRPETQYRLVMTSSINGSLLGSSPVIFFHTPPTMPLGFVAPSYGERPDMLSAEEIGIIVIVLGVWMMAIMLFFNRWGKIRMLEPYEYNFKYHHPIPEVAAHRPSCPLADGAPLLQTSFDRHCSLDRRLTPYGRRCSSLSAYLAAEPRMIRNNSDPAPPPPPAGQARPTIFRNSMQELRREPTAAGSSGRGATSRQAEELAQAVQAAGGAGGPSAAAAEGPASGETAGKRRQPEPSRDLLERTRQLVVTRELVEAGEACADTEAASTSVLELDKRQKMLKPVQLVCCEADHDLVLDSEV